MAKIHRISAYIIDQKGQYTADDIGIGIECDADKPVEAFVKQMHTETSEEFEWNDNLPEAKPHCDLAQLAKHFLPNSEEHDAKQVKIGSFYRHFKGKMVYVIAVCRHSETQELLVVYSCDNGTGTWCRPLSMFLSDVDAEKYPEHAGKKRFELVT